LASFQQALKEKEHLIEDLQRQKDRLQQRVSQLEEEEENSALSRLATPRSSMKSGGGAQSLFAARDKETKVFSFCFTAESKR
jgi:hypothetical protein